MTSTFDAIIVGAGVAGVSTAYYLSTQHNLRDILLIDKRPPMTFTSDKSGSNYRNWWPNPDMVQLANRSITLMDEIAEQRGNFFNLNRRGYAYISNSADIATWLSRYKDEGIGSIRTHTTERSDYPNNALDGADVLLGSDYVRGHYPFLGKGTQSVTHARRGGWLSTRVLFHHMLDAATQRGLVEMRGDVTDITSRGGIATLNVETAQGTVHVETPKLILAAGPFLTDCAQMLGFDLPLYSVLHQKVTLRDVDEVVPSDAPFMIFRDSPQVDWTADERAYLQAHHGDGDLPGNFHLKRANDGWIIAGWAFNRAHTTPVGAPQLDDMFTQVVLRGLATFVPGIANYIDQPRASQIISGGYYTRTATNLPIMGHAPVDGVYVIGGLSGFGVMVACGAGERMSSMVMHGDAANTFSLDEHRVQAHDSPLAIESGEL